MPTLNPQPAEDLQTEVFMALGAASTCWETMSGTGVFESDRAKKIGDDLVGFIEANYRRVTPVRVEEHPDQLALFAVDSF